MMKGGKRALETGLAFEGRRCGGYTTQASPPGGLGPGWGGGEGMKTCRVAALQIESEAQEVEEQEMDGCIRGS